MGSDHQDSWREQQAKSLLETIMAMGVVLSRGKWRDPKTGQLTDLPKGFGNVGNVGVSDEVGESIVELSVELLPLIPVWPGTTSDLERYF